MQKRGQGAALIKEHNLQALEQRDETIQVTDYKTWRKAIWRCCFREDILFCPWLEGRKEEVALHVRPPKFHCSSDPDGTILPSRITRRSSYYFMPLSFKISLLNHSVFIMRRCKKRAVLPSGWIWWVRERGEKKTHTLHFPWRAVWDFQSSALTHKILRANFQLHLCHFHYHSTRPEVIMDSVNCSLFPSQTTRAFTWGQLCTRGGPDIC